MEREITDVYPETGWWVLRQDDTLVRRAEPGVLAWRNQNTHLRDNLRHVGLGRLCLGVEKPRVPFEWPCCTGSEWPISLLKSAVQKAVRRSRTQTALHLCAQIIRQGRHDFLHLLRRLPVVCIEDAVPHADLDFVVWLMAAMAHGFEPSVVHVERIGQFVADLSACRWRFPRHKATLDELREQPTPNASLPLACLVRSCYGGTKGDMRLLRGVPWHFLIQLCPVTPGRPSILTLDDLDTRWQLSEAVDFHCCPNMIRDIKRELPHVGYSKKQIREAIWHCRSSITDKCIYMTERPFATPDPTHCAVFEEIQDFIKDYSRVYWRRFLKKEPSRKAPHQTLISHFFQ